MVVGWLQTVLIASSIKTAVSILHPVLGFASGSGHMRCPLAFRVIRNINLQMQHLAPQYIYGTAVLSFILAQ